MENDDNRYISVLYRHGQRFLAQRLKSHSIPVEVAQIPYLVQIYRNPGITQDGISSNIGIDKGTTARCMAQMEETGLILRRIDEKDRRVNHIFATPKVQELKGEVYQVIQELHELLYQGFSEMEIDTASVFLCRMNKNMEDYMDTKSKEEANPHKGTSIHII